MNIILINNNDTDGVGQHFSRAVNQLNYIGHKADRIGSTQKI